jgi:Zn-dependent peptidase ImmA (M78 family)
MVRVDQTTKAIDRARALSLSFQYLSGSVNLTKLAAALGIQSIEPAEISADGYLGRQIDGTLVIRYRSQNGAMRNRFTIAHEVAHVVLAEAQGKNLTAPSGGYTRDRDEETVVNRVASELLMPAHTILDDLRRRWFRHERPSWGIIGQLSQIYKVSRSAMAFRILEIPDITAISLRINLEGRGPQYPLDRSEGRRIRLLNGVEYEIERLWRESRKTKSHVVAVRAESEVLEIQCNGMIRSLTTRLGRGRQYWVIGWTVLGAPNDREGPFG